MKLIVGLGNPGKEYDGTRHNTGFFMIDNYLKYKGISGTWRDKFSGLYLDANINDEKVIFLKPQKFMNLSGEVVRDFVNFYRIDISDILIISDDLDLNVGNFKLKCKGSSGGHNGLKDIEKNLGTNHFNRIKVGIGSIKNGSGPDYVLGKFSSDDLNLLKDVSDTINLALDDYFKHNFDYILSKYNRKNK